MKKTGEERQRIVTIFGGAKCGPDSEEYEMAVTLGETLAARGFTVCTGGYSGVMEGASKGAKAAGGRVLGITMNQFPSEPNAYLTERIETDHFYERLQNLITRSVGFIALKGGMGTVTEISLVWNKLQTKVIPPRPLVLLGGCWPGVVDAWRRHLVVSDEDVKQLAFAVDAEQAASIIIERAPRY